MSALSKSRPPASLPVVFVIDGDRSVREWLESLISLAGWQPRVCASAREFLDLPRATAASCLISNIAPPDLCGLELQKRLADRTWLPIIFMTDRPDIPTTVKAMKAGALEFLAKPLEAPVLVRAIHKALEDSHQVLSEEATAGLLRERYASLSQREKQVMALVVSGWLNKQVGAELGITEITVKAHRGNVMRKMEAGSLPELVTIAAGLGVRRILPPASARVGQMFRHDALGVAAL